MTAARELAALLGDAVPAPHAKPAPSSSADDDRRAAALRLAELALPAQGTPVVPYLTGRCLPWDDALPLRFLPQAKHPCGRRLPVILALQSAFDRIFDGADNRAEERISRFADETSRASRNVDELASLGRDFATVFTSAFDGLTTQGGKLSDVLDRLGLGLARILERQFITKPLESALTSSLGQGGFLRGIFDSAGSALSGLLGFRADGGPVSAGSPYIVGERGPELFVPNFSGTIVPNHAMGGGAVFNIDARGAEPGVEARIRAVLAQEAPKLSAYVRSDLAARVNRGGNEALTFGRRRT